MPDSESLKTERRVQPLFSKSNVFSGLVLFAAVMGLDRWIATLPNRADRPDRVAAVRFVPVNFDRAGFAPLRLAGAWRVAIDDPRFGGVSALALDNGGFLALTDSGTSFRFAKPGAGHGRASVRDLPAGPSSPSFKSNRDSEALARDPSGRGWWVAFKRHHQLWLYDPELRRPLARIDLGSGRWRANRGIEAMIADRQGLILFPETGGQWLRIRGGEARTRRLASRYGFISDGARAPDGRLLLVARKLGLAGIDKRLAEVEVGKASLRLRSLARLALGPIDNVESIAAEPRANGVTRLWLMTDNDFYGSRPTLLVALDMPPKP